MAPVPFEIVADGPHRVATNGSASLVLLEADGMVFRRRGLRGVALNAPGSAVLPELNRLAGDLVARLDMPKAELAERLAAITALACPPEPEPIEWAVAELQGVRVYYDGTTVLVTRQDLLPRAPALLQQPAAA